MGCFQFLMSINQEKRLKKAAPKPQWGTQNQVRALSKKMKLSNIQRNTYQGITCGKVPSEGGSIWRSLTSEEMAKTMNSRKRTAAFKSHELPPVSFHALIIIKVQLSAIIGVLMRGISLSQG